MIETVALVVSGIALTLNIVMAWIIHELRAERNQATSLAEKALDAEARTEDRLTEFQKIHADLLARPVNVLVPQDFVQNLGNALIQYLESGNELIAPIYPKRDKPQ